MQAKLGDRVQVHYTGRLADGQPFESSEGHPPLEIELGAGLAIRGVEQGLVGMSEGDRKTVEIPHRQAYGPYRDDLVVETARADVPSEIELAIGLQLHTKSEAGQVVPLRVVGLSPQTVTLDANHPLAGKDLVFEIELVRIVA